MTTTFTIHNETSSRYDEFAVRLTKIADGALPLVEDVTGLAMPDEMVVRLMAPRDWKRRNMKRLRRLYRTEKAELGPPAADVITTNITLQGIRMFLRTRWVQVNAMTGEYTPGRQEIAIVPRALEEAGRLHDDRHLHEVIAHEATHLAQHHASRDTWGKHLGVTLFPRVRGVRDRESNFLVEGHAFWAGRKVTGKLLGIPDTPVPDISPHASRRYRAISETKLRKRQVATNERACQAVTDIIDTIGTTRFNRVWHNADLIPTTAEAADPARWQTRLHTPDPE